MERRTRRRPQRILIVEDSDDIRQMWGVWLGIWGFEVDEARNGAEAVEKARAERPDLVLMDLCMPVLDGFTATAALKHDPATAGIPVLATSAHSGDCSSDHARTAGCEAFLPKPLDPDDLLREVRGAFLRLQCRGSVGERICPPN